MAYVVARQSALVYQDVMAYVVTCQSALVYQYVMANWASEASPTLGCSIEISRDIYMCMCLSYVKLTA